MNHSPVIADATFHLPFFAENNTIIGTVFALDPDEFQELSFSILRWISVIESPLEESFAIRGQFTSSHFAIDPSYGTLSLMDPGIFSHSIDKILLRVMVMDNGYPSLNDT